MPFSEEQLREQEKQIKNLKEELSILNSRFEGLIKENGITPDTMAQSRADVSPELEKELRKAQEEAKRAGAARAAQAAPAAAGRAPGRIRRGAIRL